MDEKELQNAIREGLTRLRASRPELSSYSRFTKKSGIHRPTVESTEDGRTTPGIETIEKWVTACGSTLSKFFADIESPAAEEKKIPIVHGYEPLYRMLATIIEKSLEVNPPNKRRIDGIRLNLEDISARAEAEAALAINKDRAPPGINRLKNQRTSSR